MQVCDICCNDIQVKGNYILTTRHVVTSPKFWTWILNAIAEKAGITMEQIPPTFLQDQLNQSCGQTTGWLVCQECISLFSEKDIVQGQKNMEAWASTNYDSDWQPPNGGSMKADCAEVMLAVPESVRTVLERSRSLSQKLIDSLDGREVLDHSVWATVAHHAISQHDENLLSVLATKKARCLYCNAVFSHNAVVSTNSDGTGIGAVQCPQCGKLWVKQVG